MENIDLALRRGNTKFDVAQKNAKIVSFINLKGGVGKTTLCLSIGEFLAFAMKKDVLIIDLDSQSNLTSAIVSPSIIDIYKAKKGSIYHLFNDLLSEEPTFHVWNLEEAVVPPTSCSNIRKNEHLSAILSLPELGQFDESLAEALEKCLKAEGKKLKNIRWTVEWRKILKNRLEPLRSKYDYILIDCPPSLSLFTSNALVASDYYLTPISPEYLSIQGLDLIQQRLSRLIKIPDLNMEVKFLGCVVNRIDIRRNDHKRYCETEIYKNTGKFNTFKYWVGDLKPMYLITEYFYPISTYGRNWNSIEEKYNNKEYDYTNPKKGILHIYDENEKYCMYERLYHLTNEFMQRCK